MHHYSAGTLHLFACIMCNTHCISIAGCIFWTNHLSIDFFASLLNCPRCKLPATGEWSNLAHEISQRRHLWTQIRNIAGLDQITLWWWKCGSQEVKKKKQNAEMCFTEAGTFQPQIRPIFNVLHVGTLHTHSSTWMHLMKFATVCSVDYILQFLSHLTHFTMRTFDQPLTWSDKDWYNLKSDKGWYFLTWSEKDWHHPKGSSCKCGMEGTQRIVGGEDSTVFNQSVMQARQRNTKKDRKDRKDSYPKYSEWKISLAGFDQLWLDGRLESGRMRGNSCCIQLGCHRGALYQVRRLFTSENAKKDSWGTNFEAFVKQRQMSNWNCFNCLIVCLTFGVSLLPKSVRTQIQPGSVSPSGKPEQRQRTTFPLCLASSTSAATVTASTPKGFGSLDLQAPKILPGKMSSLKLTRSYTRITTPLSLCPTTSPCSSSLRRSNSTK